VPSALSVRAPVRRDVAVALVLAMLLFALARFGHRAGSTAEALGAAALCLPLAWRSRWPLQVLLVVACGGVLYLGLVRATNNFLAPVMLALYTVTAVGGSRQRTVAIGGVALLYAIFLVLVFSPEPGSTSRQIVGTAALLGLGIAVGEAVRSHRALLGAMRERAERAEREQELQTRREVDEERLRIARDVHDLVAHNIATISTQASVGAHIGREDPVRAVEALDSISIVSTRALEDLRHALGVVRDENGRDPTAPAPSVHDVSELVEQARDAGMSVELTLEGSSVALAPGLQIAVYRIVQEALTNVMRHAQGAHAAVRITSAATRVEVEVRNDGAGRASSASVSGSHSGLVGMRERARSLGGSFEAAATARGGFRVHATLPLGLGSERA
jgi:signal transduction histidine kinase